MFFIVDNCNLFSERSKNVLKGSIFGLPSRELKKLVLDNVATWSRCASNYRAFMSNLARLALNFIDFDLQIIFFKLIFCNMFFVSRIWTYSNVLSAVRSKAWSFSFCKALKLGLNYNRLYFNDFFGFFSDSFLA